MLDVISAGQQRSESAHSIAGHKAVEALLELLQEWLQN